MLHAYLVFIMVLIIQNTYILSSNEKIVDQEFEDFVKTLSTPEKSKESKKNFRPQSFSFKLFTTQALISGFIFGGAAADIWINHPVASGPPTIVFGISACNCFFSVFGMLKTYRWKKQIIIQQQ